MEDALHRFHTLKVVFLLGRAGKQKKVKANALTTELVKKRKVDHETNAETWMLSEKQGEMNASRDYISQEIDNSNELDAYFNFLKIHLISHWAELIRRYRALQQYSAKRHEQAQKTNPQGWLEHLQSQSQQPVTSNDLSASQSLLRNQRGQSPTHRSALGEQRCRLQSLPFRC
jgi:hypothetical protein